MELKEMIAQRDVAFEKANTLLTAVDARDGKMTDDERAELKRYSAELADIGDKIADAEKKAAEDAEARAYIRKLGSGMKAGNADPEQARVHDGLAQGKSLGAIFAESPQFKAFMAQFPNGRIPDSAKHLNSHPAEIPIGGKKLAALLTGLSSTAAGAFVVAEDSGLYVPTARRELSIVDLIDVRDTGSDAVDFVRQTAFTNAAAATAEATTTSNGTKPESSMAFERVSCPVETIAHWIPATKRALSDVGQLRGLIDADMRYGLNEEVEDQVMNGDGSTPNLAGIFNTSNVQTRSYITDLPTTTRKAVTLMKTVAKERPTGWVFNPSNWESFDLLKGTDVYFFGGLVGMGARSLWGYPVVESEAMLEGHAFLGNWKRAVLWIREGITISVSDSHANFFVQNLVAILAEMRAAFGVTKPTAFVNVSLSAAS